MLDSITDILPACFTSFKVEEISEMELSIEATSSFSPTFIGFQGHFPGRPILPAIIQLAAIRCIAEKALECPLYVAGYSRTKFKAMIVPDMEIRFHIKLEQRTADIPGKFKILSADQKTVASGSFVFRQEPL